MLPEKTKISNVKRTVTKYLQKNPESRNEIFTSFYDREALLFLGAACEKNGITKTLLSKIWSSSS